MFKVDEGNIITPQNKIIARKCYAILRKEIQFYFDGLEHGMPSENLIQIYENVIHICMTDINLLYKRKILDIYQKHSLKTGYIIEMCSIKWKTTSKEVELEVFCQPVYVRLDHHLLQQSPVSKSLVVFSKEKVTTHFTKNIHGNIIARNIIDIHAEVSDALAISEAVVEL